MAKKQDNSQPKQQRQPSEQEIQQLQMLEQNFQALMMQKQAFQMELNESKTALEEIEKSKDDVFRVVGQIMIKADKKNLKKELSEKKDILNLRMKSIEKQEKEFMANIERIRNNIVNQMG